LLLLRSGPSPSAMSVRSFRCGAFRGLRLLVEIDNCEHQQERTRPSCRSSCLQLLQGSLRLWPKMNRQYQLIVGACGEPVRSGLDAAANSKYLHSCGCFVRLCLCNWGRSEGGFANPAIRHRPSLYGTSGVRRRRHSPCAQYDSWSPSCWFRQPAGKAALRVRDEVERERQHRTQALHIRLYLQRP
jgi:hypothetical protein